MKSTREGGGCGGRSRLPAATGHTAAALPRHHPVVVVVHKELQRRGCERLQSADVINQYPLPKKCGGAFKEWDNSQGEGKRLEKGKGCVWQKTNGTHNRSFFGFRLTNLIFFRRLNVNCSSSSAAAPPPKRAGATEEPDQKSKSCRRSTSLKSHLNTSQNYQTERKREREEKKKNRC